MSVSVSGIDKVISKVSSLLRSSAIGEILRDVAEATRTKTKHSVEVGRDPDTEGVHAPLSAETKKNHPSGKALYRTGSLLRQAGDYVVNSSKATILLGMEYARYHQYGTKHIPQRKFIPIERQWYIKQSAKAMGKVIRRFAR